MSQFSNTAVAMTVMCHFMRSRAQHGAAKVLGSYVLQRNKTTLVDSYMHSKSSPPHEIKKRAKPFPTKSPINPNYVPYLDMFEKRRDEAGRSILIEIEGIKDSIGLKHVCERIGPVNKYYLYRNSGKNFVLVEFKSIAAKYEMVKQAFHSKDPQSIPVTSPFLYFQHNLENVSGSALPDSTALVRSNDNALIKGLVTLSCDDDDRLVTEMKHIHATTRISDLSTRLRFFTCHQLDVALGGLFLDVRCLPFGSSVCGLGRNTADLDIFLHFRRNFSSQKTTKSRVYFHTKSWVRDKNVQLKLLGDLISVMLPGCSGVMSILSAKVPIIKYSQTITDLECDLQNSSPSGVDLSHILWVMNHWDDRVAPVAYTVKLWTSHNQICCIQKPGPFITNFSMMIMIIFFFQNLNILPALRLFHTLPASITVGSLDPNSLLVFPDLRKVFHDMLPPPESGSEYGVDTLLIKFFEFYASFNFEGNSISIYTGKAMPKKSDAPLEIDNPVNSKLNVAANVNLEGLLVFTRAVKAALLALDKESYKSCSVSALLPNRPAEGRPGSLRERNVKKYK